MDIVPSGRDPNMANLVESEGGVFIDQDPFPAIGRDEIEFLKRGLARSPRGRTRLCTHKKSDNRVHEMFISFVGRNYVRPARHLGKDESLHLLEGYGEYYFFDNRGQVTDMVPLGPYGSSAQFYCRIPARVEHAVIIRSDQLAFHEATMGPFDRKDTILSPWSPVEGDMASIKVWMSGLPSDAVVPRPLLKTKRVEAGLLVADEAVVSVGAKEVDGLKREMQRARLLEIKLAIHQDSATTLQESITLRHREKYVRPRLLTDDASIHVLEGAADVIVFDGQGAILNSVRLQGSQAGGKFYARSPALTYRYVLPRSDVLVMHEINAAPQGTEASFAPWSPLEEDLGEVGGFLQNLSRAVSA
jgi:cupin fold WbuC family metalloprotein